MSDEAEKLARHTRKIARYEGITQGQGQVLNAAAGLIESQARQIAALTGSIQDISTGWDKTLEQLAERDAVIEQIRDVVEPPVDGADERIIEILAASPVSVLAEDYTIEVGGQTFSKAQWDAFQIYAKGTSSPAEYRKGAGQ